MATPSMLAIEKIRAICQQMPVILWATFHHLGGSSKSAHEGANFMASLF
jgi:hypothetical protein